jgi:hypothetical protein
MSRVAVVTGTGGLSEDGKGYGIGAESFLKDLQR